MRGGGTSLRSDTQANPVIPRRPGAPVRRYRKRRFFLFGAVKHFAGRHPPSSAMRAS
jgi:hypothetical protein